MNFQWPPAFGKPPVSAVLRASPEDFIVHEQLGFTPSGSGEHVFLHLEKRLLNTSDLQERLAKLSGVPLRDIGYSGMKDRNAVTRQWFSVQLPGKADPDWRTLESDGQVVVLEVKRHLRKLKRGVHQANQFILRLTQLEGDHGELRRRLEQIAQEGVPNYFGPQRFGREGQTLIQARRWMSSPGRKLSRRKRGLYLSAMRSYLFNELLGRRVKAGSWNRVSAGDVGMLHGNRSRFEVKTMDEAIDQRSAAGDIHPGLPLWGSGPALASGDVAQEQSEGLADFADECAFLEREGLELDYRSARLKADDFCWQFCDDGSLQLTFSLPPGGYATAVVSELVQLTKGNLGSGNGGE